MDENTASQNEQNNIFTYEPNQDIYEQRKLRRDYRALLASAQSMYLISLIKRHTTSFTRKQH